MGVTIRVDLGPRSYDIVIGPGLIAEAGAHIRRLDPKAACAIVTDTNVARHHLGPLTASLDAAGIRHASIMIEPGEGSKSYAGFATVCDAILSGRFERGDFVVALGGGVVGDLAGFAAASLKRGMRVVQIPTSLLAQVDSSVGGKTAINSPVGKNLVGAFHQPTLVLADVGALDTLPRRELTAGYAELAKYGLIDDAAFFEWLERNRAAIVAGGPERIEAIAQACRSKAAIVARDETEQGDRALLNLGHTFGHAFERLTGYDGARLVHGEGVALGICLAFRFSTRLGVGTGQDADRVARHFQAAGLPTEIRDVPGFNASPDAMLDAIGQDKKVQRGSLTFILAHGIGRSYIAKGVDAADVRSFLTDEMGRN
ncbi:3-dehydroquinate synthase [Lichenihabitans sp. PAMC28606]|uniref:3-dehydroquinate synthase n=1 Tax=Lichenihabitans sp. PAMC28606 TaxID=2880932 RepID=UPI001D0B74CE|nr:3-dehydroquinate synthase [Lichenihabitans sp. PAMC28606]UDL93350.1 3-dehydroquinate synthase [Lichenihabitans sp. PAMC28606]